MFWFKKKQKPQDDRVILHGHDLAKWHYLGYSSCRFLNDRGETSAEFPYFLFVRKEDFTHRSSFIPDEKVAVRSHPFFNKQVKPWVAGEKPIFYLIRGRGSVPSDFLSEYMLETYGKKWDSKLAEWYSTHDAKFKQAYIKQKTKPTVNTLPETNIVTVDFGKEP